MMMDKFDKLYVPFVSVKFSAKGRQKILCELSVLGSQCNTITCSKCIYNCVHVERYLEWEKEKKIFG